MSEFFSIQHEQFNWKTKWNLEGGKIKTKTYNNLILWVCTPLNWYFVEAPSDFITALNLFDSTWQYLPALLLLKRSKICQIARTSPVRSPLQITLQMFNWIQVWARVGPFQNVNLLVEKPCFCWCGCMLWVVLKGEITLHLQLSNGSLKVLCQNWLVFGTVHNSLHLE